MIIFCNIINQSFSIFPFYKTTIGSVQYFICCIFHHYLVIFLIIGRECYSGVLWPQKHEVRQCCWDITALPQGQGQGHLLYLADKENRCAATHKPNHVIHTPSQPSTWIQIHSNVCITKMHKKRINVEHRGVE